MKASEITKSGFYWCQKPPSPFTDDDWLICLVDVEGGSIEFCGTDNSVTFPGHRPAGFPESLSKAQDDFLASTLFEGPLNPPSANEGGPKPDWHWLVARLLSAGHDHDGYCWFCERDLREEAHADDCPFIAAEKALKGEI